MLQIILAFLWVLVGLAAALVHLLLLRVALNRVSSAPSYQAARRIALGLPLRLLALTPFLWGAAKSGLLACGGLMVGLLLGRWLLYRQLLRGNA